MKKSRWMFGLLGIALVVAATVLWARREPTFKTPTEMQLQKFLPADTRKVFENATTWTLFSLEPEPQKHEKSREQFHDFDILGETAIADKATRSCLQQALYGAIANYSGDGASCFNPHHGLRATYKNRTVDLILCFDCGTSYFYIGDKRYDAFVATNSRDSSKVFDRVLEANDAS